LFPSPLYIIFIEAKIGSRFKCITSGSSVTNPEYFTYDHILESLLKASSF